MDVSKQSKTLRAVLGARSDANIRFKDLLQLMLRLGFELRIRGDHYILFKHGIDEILNIQPKNGMAKPYQVKQIRALIFRYRLEASLHE